MCSTLQREKERLEKENDVSVYKRVETPRGFVLLKIYLFEREHMVGAEGRRRERISSRLPAEHRG